MNRRHDQRPSTAPKTHCRRLVCRFGPQPTFVVPVAFPPSHPQETTVKKVKPLRFIALLTLCVGSVNPSPHAEPNPGSKPWDLVAMAASAGLVDPLQGAGPFTVFAPTDSAFAQPAKGTSEPLLQAQNTSRLAAILTCHGMTGERTAVPRS